MSIEPRIITKVGTPQGNAAKFADLQRAINKLQTAAGSLAPGSVTGDRIAANTITAAEIAAGTITATNIVAGTITAAQIAAGTITAANIAAGTITATQIAANTITAANIAAGAITAYIFNGQTITLSQGGLANVTLDSTGVKGYDATGTLKFEIDSTTGLITATGVLTATAGSSLPAGVITGSLPGSANRYSNSTFQNGQGVFDATGWSLTNATAASGGTTVPPVYGALTAQLTSTGGDISLIASPTTDQFRRVLPGLNYTLSHYVYPTTTARQSRIDVNWYNSGGTLLSTTTGTAHTTLLNAYTRIVTTAQAPAGAAYGTGVHYVGLSSVASELFYVDAFQMEMADTASSWAPRPDEILYAQINADRINVANLAAISASLGSITSGSLTSTTISSATITSATISSSTITGSTIQTSASDPRTAMDSNGVWATNGSGTKMVGLDHSNGLQLVAGSSGINTISWHSSSISGSQTANITALSGGISMQIPSGGVVNCSSVVQVSTAGGAATVVDGSGNATWSFQTISAGTFHVNSAREIKQNFKCVDTRDVLAKISKLEVTEHEYIALPGVRKLGPAAEDFDLQFGLGRGRPIRTDADPVPRGVSISDLASVGLLGVQELTRRVGAIENGVNIDAVKAFVAAPTFEDAKKAVLASNLRQLEAAHFEASLDSLVSNRPDSGEAEIEARITDLKSVVSF